MNQTSSDGPIPAEILPDYAPQTLHQNQLSEEAFILHVGILVNSGLIVSQLIAWLLPAYQLAGESYWPAIFLIPAGVLAMLGGIELAIHTKDWKGSLVGLALSSLGLGLILSPWSGGVELAIQQIASGFGLGLFTLTIAGYLKPGLLRGFGSFPVGMLPVILVAVVPSIPIPILNFGPWHLIAIAAILAFYDLYLTRAFKLPRTENTAVDTACALYMDAVDRFFRIIIRT